MTPMMYQYFEIKKNYPEYILVFRSGDFYEMFFEDAIKASKALDITLTKRGRHNGMEIPMCGIPAHALDNYLQKLIKKGILAAVCDQIEDAETAKQNKRIIKREITRLVTPGTLTEDNLLDARENNYIASIVSDKKTETMAISWLDMSTGDFYFAKSTLSTFFNDLSSFGPKEILLSDDLRNNETVTKLLKDFYITVRPEQKKGSQVLAEYFKDMDINTMSSIEASACSLLFSYIEETQRGKMPQLSTPSRFTSEKTLQIDPATRKSLELTRTLSGEKTGSLISVIDRTITPQGGRLLTTRLNCPSINVKEINDRLDSVDYFKRMYPTFIDDIRSILKRCHDIERCLQRLSLRRGSPRDLNAIGITIGEAQKLKQFLLDSEDQNFPKPLLECIHCIKDLSNLEKEILSALRENLPFNYSDGGFIKNGYSKEFDEWSNLKENAKDVLNELQKKYIKRTGIGSLKIEDNGIVGIYINVPISQMNRMQEFNEFVLTQTTKNQVRYKTTEISTLQDKLSSANEETKNIELKIFEQLTDKVVERAEDLSELSKSISSIDLYSSFALLSTEKNLTKPMITDDLDCEIIGGRHPVVEHFLSKSGIQFTNNNCHLEEDKNRILLILGPNMGGKSTYLRQNALIIIMAQMGCYVPVQQAKIGIVDKIFSRVGASDNLANDLSTFMIEMIETANILKKATKRSFVIMDEIGRGTSTLDGLAIAISVVEYLNDELKSRTLFATHYHELVDLKNDLKLLSSYKLDVKENNGNIIFTYKVVPGETDRSYGVHVAQLAGIPNSVVVRAQEILDKLEKQKQKFKFK